MSQQQINRILNSDLSDIDKTVTHKISSIEQITGHLNEKTNFLAQFQLMLEQELSSMKQQKPSEYIPPLAKGQSNNSQLKEITKITTKGSIFEDASLLQLKDNKILTERVQMKNNEKQNIRKDQKYRSIKDYVKQIRKLNMKVCQIKELMRFIKKDIKEKINLEYHHVFAFAKEQFEQCFSQLKQNHIEELQKMLKINHQLNQKISQMNEQNSRLKQQLKSTKNKQQRIQESLKQISSGISKTLFSVPLKLQKRIDTSRHPSTSRQKIQKINHYENICKSICYNYPCVDQDQYLTSRQLEEQQMICLPNINVLSVGIPPVKNGFGVLKAGAQIIYRGMWKNGKFDGKGKLSWQSYSYEGDFVQGCFQGYGKLQIELRRIFWGQFIGQKAQGQGTLEQDGIRIAGFWKQNRLIQRY